MSRRLALLGGTPLFDRPRPIGQFAAPPLGEVVELLSATRGRRFELVERLERVLAIQHAVDYCVAVCSAGHGMTLLMRLLGGSSGGDVIMPAFTFRGLPHFARAAGFAPRFCDVSEQTHALDARAMESAITENTKVVLAVCNFNDPGDVAALEDAATAASTPIIFDSVYATGSRYRGRPLGSNGAAEVFSLHATKLINGFEGGYITTNDGDLAARLRNVRDRDGAEFESRPSEPYIDCSLHPYHAATALQSIAHLQEVVDRNRARYEAYLRVCGSLQGIAVLPYPSGPDESPHYELTVLEVGSQWPLSRDETLRVLRAEGAVISAYYSPALHQPPYYTGTESYVLPATENLARRFSQLPGGELMSIADIEAIGDVLATIASDPEPVVARLRGTKS